MPTPHICQHPRSTVLGDLNAPCSICNPVPLDKEIRKEWLEGNFNPKLNAEELSTIADWWLDKFLTMLPPEKEMKKEEPLLLSQFKEGWNDYRRAYLNNINK